MTCFFVTDYMYATGERKFAENGFCKWWGYTFPSDLSFFSWSFTVHFAFEIKYTFSCDFYA